MKISLLSYSKYIPWYTNNFQKAVPNVLKWSAFSFSKVGRYLFVTLFLKTKNQFFNVLYKKVKMKYNIKIYIILLMM